MTLKDWIMQLQSRLTRLENVDPIPFMINDHKEVMQKARKLIDQFNEDEKNGVISPEYLYRLSRLIGEIMLTLRSRDLNTLAAFNETVYYATKKSISEIKCQLTEDMPGKIPGNLTVDTDSYFHLALSEGDELTTACGKRANAQMKEPSWVTCPICLEIMK